MPELLHLCRNCAEPFVVPVELLEIVDEGLYLVALQCAACDHLALAEAEDEALEALDRHLDATAAQMHDLAARLAAGVEPRLDGDAAPAAPPYRRL